MKAAIFFASLVCICLFSCNKSTSTNPDPDTTDSSEHADSTIEGEAGTFTFTARGEKADCSGYSEDGAYQNDAVFIHTRRL